MKVLHLFVFNYIRTFFFFFLFSRVGPEQTYISAVHISGPTHKCFSFSRSLELCFKTVVTTPMVVLIFHNVENRSSWIVNFTSLCFFYWWSQDVVIHLLVGDLCVDWDATLPLFWIFFFFPVKTLEKKFVSIL